MREKSRIFPWDLGPGAHTTCIGPIHGRAYYGGGGGAYIRTTFDVSDNIYSTCKLYCERK
jgi:hypothetical protein